MGNGLFPEYEINSSTVTSCQLGKWIACSNYIQPQQPTAYKQIQPLKHTHSYISKIHLYKSLHLHFLTSVPLPICPTPGQVAVLSGPMPGCSCLQPQAMQRRGSVWGPCLSSVRLSASDSPPHSINYDLPPQGRAPPSRGPRERLPPLASSLTKTALTQHPHCPH